MSSGDNPKMPYKPYKPDWDVIKKKPMLDAQLELASLFRQT